MSSRGLLLLLTAVCGFAQSRIAAPRIWNDRDLAEWATPLAKLKVRPGHLSEKEYYSVPEAEWVRTYPVYYPGHEFGLKLPDADKKALIAFLRTL